MRGNIGFQRQSVPMSCILLLIWMFVLSKPVDHSLLIDSVARNRRDKVRYNHQETDWDNLFCLGVLPLVSGSILAKSSCASFILCIMWRVWIPLCYWDSVSISFHKFGRVCHQCDSPLHHKKILLNSNWRVLGWAKNRTLEIISPAQNRSDLAQLRISYRLYHKI